MTLTSRGFDTLGSRELWLQLWQWEAIFQVTGCFRTSVSVLGQLA